jgi:uncharacterized protein (TIGR02145 family)
MKAKIISVLFLIFIYSLFPLYVYSQGEFNNWYFGVHAGLNFSSGSPVVLNNCSPLFFAPNSSATVSDSSGDLLFYADYVDVFNRNHAIMPNGNGLFSQAFVNQPVLPVMKLDDDSAFYLFTMDKFLTSTDPDPKGLSYSIIDMRLDGGLGDIVTGEKNIRVPGAEQTSQALCGTRHHNNHDVWIVTRKYMNGDKYLAYLITKTGIDTVPIISNSFVPSTIPFFGFNNPPVMLKISPDGSKLVCLYDSIAEYCNFNSSTGEVTPLFCFKSQSNSTTYFRAKAEFSIDSKYLYVNGYGGNQADNIWQYDASKSDSTEFMQSEVLIYSNNYEPMESHFGLQLGPDNKIYCTQGFVDSLSVINNPTIQGAGCNFQRNAICLLNTNLSYWGLPQLLQKYKAYFHYASICQNYPTHFLSDMWPPADSIHWDFGDPASGPSNYSNLANPSHFYTTPGSYTVELFVKHIDHRTDTTWQVINILANPQPALGSDKTICIGDSLTFDAGACSGCTYLWKDLGTGLPVGASQTFKTGLAGSYSATVTNSNGCIGRDTVQLTTTPIPLVTNNKLTDTICSGESTNIPLTSVPTGANFHWTATLTSGTVTGFNADSGLVINQVLTDLLPTPGIVTYHITPKIGSCTGATVDFQVTVIPGDSVKVDIAPFTNNVCAGTPVTFTAIPTNPGLTPFFQWKVNGGNQGTNSTVFTYVPTNGDLVSCTLTSSLTVCVSNNPASSIQYPVSVSPNLPVSITLTSAPATICAGQQVTFTAHPGNGGTTPAYQWYLNSSPAGTNSDTYTFTPVNGDLVSCTLTSSETCTINNPAPSTQYPVTVTPLTPVSITITSSQNPFCAGSSITFNATPNGGGLTPSYQWKVNGVNVGGGASVYTYTPGSGDIVCCILNSSLPCVSGNPATSNCITMIVDTGLPAGVSINAVPNPFCPGSSVTLTATPSNGGPLPTYQWKVNGINTGTGSSYTYNPVNGDSLRCIMTSNLSCVTGSPASSSKIILSGTLASSVSFAACFDTITTINAKPIKLKGGIPLGGTYTGPGVNSGNGTYTPALAGVGTHTITYSYTNAALCTALAHTHIINYPLSIVNCGTPITDPRDNKVYQTVQIGSQCWLASNLNFGSILASSQDQRDNCIAEKYCYNDNPVNCTNHGGLYQWDEVMRFDETPADQGFCPPGWHIPSENDWNLLFSVYINSGFAGSPLKYSGYSGFNALLSGARHINRGWDFQGFATFFWSSTPRSDNKAWAHGMNEVDPSVSLYPASRVNAFSVRCLKD